MERVLHEIKSCERAFAQRPFFRHLEGVGSADDVRTIAQGMTFFILAFQDVLRLVEARVRDPELHALAAAHRREDAGHERWFLRDVRALGVEADLPWLFGPQHELTRDAAYAVISEVLRAHDDRVMLAVSMAMESAGEVFLSRCNYFDAAQLPFELLFFSRRHFLAEQGHTVDTEAAQARLRAEVLDGAQWEAAQGAVHRTFRAMEQMCAGIMATLEARRGKNVA